MFRSVLVASLYLVLTAGYPFSDDFEVLENRATGEPFYLVQVEDSTQVHQRQRRQTSGSIGSDGAGISHTGTLINNNNHKLDGSVFAQKDIWRGGPLTTGGQLDYSHKPSGSAAGLQVSNTRGFGTDVAAKGNYNFYQSRNGLTTGSLSGQYGRHFGGPWGASRPTYGAFLNFNHRF